MPPQIICPVSFSNNYSYLISTRKLPEPRKSYTVKPAFRGHHWDKEKLTL